MIATVSLLLLGYNVIAEQVTMRWAKDAGLAPVYNQNEDGSLTVEYPIMEGTYEVMEEVRRRLQTEMTDQELREALLDKHNELRSLTARGLAPCQCGSSCGASHQTTADKKYHPGATNMNSLFWDPALERVAQEYSDKCLFIHNTKSNGQDPGATAEAFGYKRFSQWDISKEKYAGENLYISSTGKKIWESVWNEQDYGIGGGLLGWWNECEDYQYPEGGSCGGQVGHYTQYIRADTRFVGCGVTICPSGIATKTTTYSWANLNVVCNYYGGQYGDAPYEPACKVDKNSDGQITRIYDCSEALVASNCDPDRTPNAATGLCDGPQKADYIENPQSSYSGDKTTANGWLCYDGTQCANDPVKGSCTGREPKIPCGTGRVTPQPTPYPTNTKRPTPRPTNPPTTSKRPTPDPTTPPPPTPEPTNPVRPVTPRPTAPTPAPVIVIPDPPSSRPPTGYPTTTASPTQSPEASTGECNLEDCQYVTHIEWISPTFKYQGLGGFAMNRLRGEITETAGNIGYSSYYSWGGEYRKDEVTGAWRIWIYDDIDIDFTEMECSIRDLLIAYMRDDSEINGNKFKARMRELILEDMQGRHGINNPGYVDIITVTVTCATTDAAAFGAIDEDGNIELPFSTWNLNSYDFSDWFVLLFVLFTGCACCFGCGWAMHRRRVFKAMDDASISDFGATHETPMVTMDSQASPQHIQASHDDDYNQTYAGNEPEIEIGVSVNSNNHGIMAEDEYE